MSISLIINEFDDICAELQSEKLNTRNKAADRLDNILTNSKSDLIAFYRRRKNDFRSISWTQLFNSAVNATIRHATKIEESKEKKSAQTVRNKSYVYTLIVTKLINYSSEDNNNFLSKNTILSAFFEGYENRCSVKHFGGLFLQLLDDGIYKSNLNISELRVNEFQRILSLLFEVTNSNDDNFKYSTLKVICKTIELTEKHVQLNDKLVEYLPNVESFLINNNEREKSEATKLFYLLISQLAVDYNISVCLYIHKLLPVICSYYNYRMKIETKEIYFKLVEICLSINYINLSNEDFTLGKVGSNANWIKLLRTLLTVVETELKERKGLNKQGTLPERNCQNAFIKMSALVICLNYWGNPESTDENNIEPRKKIQKRNDSMEAILKFVQSEQNTFNEICLAILAELVTTYEFVVNVSNLTQILELCFSLIQLFTSSNHLKFIRLCLTSLLRIEKKLIETNLITSDCYSKNWNRIVECILENISLCNETMKEKQLLIQILIKFSKLNRNQCATLINSFITNRTMRRNEYIETIHQILCNTDVCIEKSYDLMTKIITWMYEKNTKINTKSILLNYNSQLDNKLMAETSLLAVIKFFQSNSLINPKIKCKPSIKRSIQLLKYKYCHEYVCIQEYGKEITELISSSTNSAKYSSSYIVESKLCILQSNYEFLMKTLNFAASENNEINDIIKDLSNLETMSILMNFFLKYNVFDSDNYHQCPLVKRIEFFLSRLELLINGKNITSMLLNKADLLDIIQRIEAILRNFFENEILLIFLGKQDLSSLIEFLGNATRFTDQKNMTDDLDLESDLSQPLLICQRQCLAALCASSTHWENAFNHLSKCDFGLQYDAINTLSVIEIICKQKLNHEKISNWLVEKVKTICKLHHTNIDITDKIVDILPEIFRYVITFEDCRHDMLIALSSFMKKANLKCYPAKITVKLLKSLQLIANKCAIFCELEDFTGICFALPKFFQSNSIQIQCASINTITALLDYSWFIGDQNSSLMPSHYKFSNQIYNLLNSKCDTMTTIDDEKVNINSMSVQLLISIFAFGSYHKDGAIQSLMDICANNKSITRKHFNRVSQIAEFFNCKLKNLMGLYAPNLIKMWIKGNQSIMKFPYFLCSDDLTSFIQSNIVEISSSILIYSNISELSNLERMNYGKQKDLIEIGLPKCLAYALANLSDTVIDINTSSMKSFSDNYHNNMENLLNNLKLANIDILPRNIKLNYHTIKYTIELINDKANFMQMFGFDFCVQETNLHSINADILYKCIEFYINLCYRKKSDIKECIAFIMKNDPNILIRLLAEFKLKILNSIFLYNQLQSIQMYCVLVNLIFDTINDVLLRRSIESLNFFVKDIVYFILNTITDKKENFHVIRAMVHFFEYLIKKPIQKDTIKLYFSDIVNALILVCENASIQEEIQIKSYNLLKFIICERNSDLKDDIRMLDEFPKSVKFNEMRIVRQTLSNSNENELESDIKRFMQKSNIRIECLKSMKNSIVRHKVKHQKLLQRDSNMLFGLLKNCMDIIRNSNEMRSVEAAAKCLGEIGGMKFDDVAYYFQSDATFYDMDKLYKDEVNFLAQCLSSVLERLFLQNNPKTLMIICEVSEQLANSKFSSKLIESYDYLKVFRLNGYKSVMDIAIAAPIDFLTILKTTEHLCYEQWIKIFSSKIFYYCKWTAFKNLSLLNEDFAEHSIIALFKLLIANENEHMPALTSMLDYFFKECFTELSKNTTTFEKILYREKRAIQNFLFICECIRIRNEWKLPINLIYVARACMYCQANFMAILYLEMWALNEKLSLNKTKSEICDDVVFQEVATKVYHSIGCSEAISAFLNPLKSRLEFLNLEGNWIDVILEADATGDTNNSLYKNNLKRNGLYLVSQWDKQNPKINYEMCWRLCQWETLVVDDANDDRHLKLNSLNVIEHEFEKYHFSALKALHNREENNCIESISNARKCIIKILKEISIECLQSVYKYLTWLHLLQRAEDFCQVQFSQSTGSDIFKKWEFESDMAYGNFPCKELLLTHQMTLFQIAGVRARRKINNHYKETNVIGNCLLKYISECKTNGAINLAIRNVAVLKSMDISDQLKVNVLLEDADLCQKTGKSLIAKAILKHIISNHDFAYCLKKIEAIRIYGEHLVDSNAESFEVVLKKYFICSIELLNQYETHKEQILKKYPDSFDIEYFANFERNHRKKTFETIAKYADREYTQLNTYCESEDFKIKSKIMIENKQEALTLAKQERNDRDKALRINVLMKNCKIDENEIEAVELKRLDNLCIAVENYMKFCQFDEAINSPAIFRLLTLWFANKTNHTLNEKIKENVNEIPSYKFLCALNQMTARLSVKYDEFLEILKQILVRCINDHPQHTLPKMFALKYAQSDNTKEKVKENDRIAISKEIIDRATNDNNKNCIKQMDNIFAALIGFANHDVGKKVSLSLNDKLKLLKNLNNVQCLTLELPISINREYSLTTIVKWEDSVTLVGGINAPKKLTCLCSDGRVRPQLLKGKDDLRQDAVMQQVLGMVNDLLTREPESREQKLSIRTYKVVPLSMRSGILEWCENTIPIGSYLMEAHKKYRPNDYTVAKCREYSTKHLKQPINKRFEIYLHICEKIQPVFHYFFFERFPIPGIWFERRMAYTNSVAITSIVGYILGIGDRHTQNILINEKTGEVIHIDFGIAFEQGKIMPTPETVPFRLTRDIVAPMGVCEVDGVFKKSCEKTMTILRRNQNVIVTILEVLLYDPLYIWKIPDKNLCNTNETNDGDKKNLTAERALIRVKEKLEGRQESKLGTTGVDIQVQRLINEAMNARNLCRLFPGWDPYL